MAAKRPMAAHVQAAIARTLQPKMPASRQAAAPAPHVQRAFAALPVQFQRMPMQRMPIQRSAMPVTAPMPAYLYHATAKKNAWSIYENGLEPRSGADDDKYVCMSADESGATTLQRAASDIVFRVASAALDASQWNKSGAGQSEWRGTETIPGSSMEWRKFLPKGSPWGTDTALFGPEPK